jgi:hypothetical protein
MHIFFSRVIPFGTTKKKCCYISRQYKGESNNIVTAFQNFSFSLTQQFSDSLREKQFDVMNTRESK